MPAAARGRPRGYGVRRLRVRLPRTRATTIHARTIPRSGTPSPSGDAVVVTDCIASTAYDSGRTSEIRLQDARQRVPRDEQPAQEELREHERGHELHGLELRAGERARQQAERRAEQRVDDGDDDEEPQRAGHVEATHPDGERAVATRAWTIAMSPKAMAYPTMKSPLPMGVVSSRSRVPDVPLAQGRDARDEEHHDEREDPEQGAPMWSKTGAGCRRTPRPAAR